MSAFTAMNPQMTEHILTPGEVAEILRCSQAAVYRLIREESLPAFRVGREYRVSLALLHSWIEAQSLPERDEWSQELEAVSEAMHRVILPHIGSQGEIQEHVTSAITRIRASSSA